MTSSRQILGIRFFNGDVDEAIASMFKRGGFLVAPSGTCFARLREDATYRRAVTAALDPQLFLHAAEDIHF